MSVGVRKAALGAAVALLAGVVAPVLFWFISLWLDRALGFGPVMARPVSLILAAAAMLFGIFWVLWAHSYLLFVGKGVPLEVFGWAIHPTRVLVTTGPYAYTRNPLALGLLFILLGVACLRSSISGLVLIPIITVLMLAYLAEFEEKALATRFGDDYANYRRGVPLLFPRLRAYVHVPGGVRS